MTIGLMVVMVAVGYMPTRALAGDGAVWAMVAGCLTSAVASWAGAVPVLLARRKQRALAAAGVTDTPETWAVMMSIVVRFAVVGILALSMAIGSGLSTAPYLIWVSISYMLFLVIDTMYTLDFGPLKWRRAHA